MDKLHIHSVLCDGCRNHQWLWYCKNGHESSAFGDTNCSDYLARTAEEGFKQKQPYTIQEQVSI